MQTIEYRVVYNEDADEAIRVQARNINSGYRKALKIALQPLGNGRKREIVSVQFSQVISF